MASFHGMWSLAGFFGALIGALMITLEWPLYIHYFIILIITLSLGLLSFHFLVDDNASENKKEQKPIFAIPDKSLMLLGFIAFASMMCEGTMFDWSGVYYDKVINAPKAYLGLAYTCFMVSMAATRFVADFFTRKLGVRNVIMMSGIFTFIGILILILIPGIYISLIAFLIIGAGVSSVVPLAFSLAGKSSTMSSSVALAAVSTMGFFGFLIGPPLIGYLASWASLKLSFGIIALMSFLVVLLSLRLKKT